jgi:YD repeat-containing protein
MKKTLNLISAVCSAVILISLAGCNINSVPRQYKKLPDSLSEEDVLLTVGIPVYKCTEYQYRDDELEEKCVYTYDEYDNILTEEITVINNDKVEYSKRRTYSYEYDENGNIIAENLYLDDNNFPNGFTQYVYDTDGLLKYEIYYSSNYAQTEFEKNFYAEYKYDSNGNEISNTEVDADGYVSSKSDTEYQYDDNGNIISKTVNVWFDPVNSKINSSISEYTYTYDEFGKILTETLKYAYDRNGKAYSYESMKIYDSNGNVIKEIIDKGSETETEKTYEYDDKNRLICENNGRTVYEYDEKNRLICEEWNNIRTVYEYEDY